MRRPGPFPKAPSCASFVPKTRSVRSALPRLAVFLLTPILLASCTPALRAQTLSGIQGTVTDQAGLPIPNAEITINNTDTGVRRNTTTGSVGSYHLTDLNPGTYTVMVEKLGFKSSVQKNVVVQVGMQSTANATLMVGDVSSTVEVTAPEISLQTEQPLIGSPDSMARA